MAKYAVLLFVLATAVFAQPAPITVRVPVDCWSSFGACRIYSSRAGGLTDDYQYLATSSPSSCSTGYQLPFGSNVESVTAEAYLFDASPSDPASVVSVHLNGNLLGAPQAVTNSTSGGCHGYAASQRHDFASGNFPSGFSGYNVRGPNSVRLETGAQQAAVEIVDLVVTYLPPRKFDFDINDFTSKADRTILISKQRTDDAFTSRFQTRDREVPIVVRANGPTGPVPNQSFYFRVLDPQSEAADAPYASDRRPNDNDDSAGGILTGTNVTPTSGVRTVSAISGPDGYVRMTMTITNYAAGDNYQIEASADPNFICPNGCDKSGVMTAWKRVYVESDRMFRAGTFLTQAASPCTGSPCPATTVLHVQDPRAIGNARRLRLIHGPRLDPSGVKTAYFEDVDVIRVNRRDSTVEVSAITQEYFGPERDPSSQTPTPLLPFLADAVGVITGNDAADFFSVNISNVGDLLTPSFVQINWLTDPVPFIPFRETIAGSGFNSDEVALTALKWFHHVNTPNHEHLLAGREGDAVQILGRTRARFGASWSWIWVGAVNSNAPRRNNGEWLLNGEVTAHEFAHLWQVNPPVDVTQGHCGNDRAPSAPRAWNNPQFFCTMHSPYDGADCGGGGRATCPEFFDGVVAFHYNGINSEYTDIRRRPDPLPHN